MWCGVAEIGGKMVRVNHEDRLLYRENPDLGLLMVDADAIIAAALDPTLTLVGEVVPEQVRLVPERSSVVQYAASTRYRDKAPKPATFVASIGRRVPEGTAIVNAGNREVAVWRVPHDPFLPGLAAVSDAESATRILSQLGVGQNVEGLRRRSYRPSRRAVIEITTEAHRVFAKVVRPRKVRRLQQLHTAIARRAPIPRSLGWSEASGIAMLQALPGRPLRQTIEDPAAQLPDPSGLVGLLETLASADVGDQLREGIVEGALRHARLIHAVAPHLGPRIDALADGFLRDSFPTPLVPVHGDFHSSQIMVLDGIPTGLIDIDTAGLGERVDDAANLLAHIAVIAEANATIRDRATAYGAELARRFDLLVDPRQLRLRVSAAILGYATGPFRVQERNWRDGIERRVYLAEQWTESAAGTR